MPSRDELERLYKRAKVFESTLCLLVNMVLMVDILPESLFKTTSLASKLTEPLKTICASNKNNTQVCLCAPESFAL